MCGGWHLDEQDISTYRSDVVLNQEVEPSQFDESTARNDFTVGHGIDYLLIFRVSDEEGTEPE